VSNTPSKSSPAEYPDDASCLDRSRKSHNGGRHLAAPLGADRKFHIHSDHQAPQPGQLNAVPPYCSFMMRSKQYASIRILRALEPREGVFAHLECRCPIPDNAAI